VRIGFIQSAPLEDDPEGNAKTLLLDIKKIVSKKPDIILIPEFFLGGSKLMAFRQKLAAIYARTLDSLKTLARDYHVGIYGSLLEKSGPKYYNTAVLIGPNGDELARYRKIHLFHHNAEHKLVAAGATPTLVDTPWGKCALLICYDLRFPELLRGLTLQGAQFALICAQWPAARADHWLTLIKARAIENQVFVFAANRIGEKRESVFPGLSSVVGPWGECLLQMGKQKSGLCTVNLSEGTRVREMFPVLNDAILWHK
jgi:predicted amidohydrolase